MMDGGEEDDGDVFFTPTPSPSKHKRSKSLGWEASGSGSGSGSKSKKNERFDRAQTPGPPPRIREIIEEPVGSSSRRPRAASVGSRRGGK